MLVIADDEQKVGELLHATPLRPAEYVWGKFLAVLAAFAGVLACTSSSMLCSITCSRAPRRRTTSGPFSAANYLRPALFFAVPQIVFFAGASFALGAWTRRPILVFFLPAAVLLVSLFFLWDWSPSWLDPRIDRALMVVDVAGLRWLTGPGSRSTAASSSTTTEPIGFDALFVASRLGFVLLGLALVHFSARRFAATLRGTQASCAEGRRAVAAHDELVEGAPAPRPLAALGMRARRPGFVRGMLEVARVELRELKSQPGLYLFVPLILLETVSVALFRARRLRHAAAGDAGNARGVEHEHAHAARVPAAPLLHRRVAASARRAAASPRSTTPRRCAAPRSCSASRSRTAWSAR